MGNRLRSRKTRLLFSQSGLILVTFGYTETPVAELGADILIDHFDELPAACARLL